jgi:PadR family transcriptional regulator PadR
MSPWTAILDIGRVSLVPRRPDTHPRTRAVFALLAGDPQQWWYGYDIARRTGLSSGTLYPLLARLADRSYLETRWESDPPTGRPRRHLYRLTADGTQRAAELARMTSSPSPARARPLLGGA